MPSDTARTMIRIHEIAANYSRPPVIWGLDSVHGANYVHGAIVTPQPINLAATFNVSMAHQAGQLASRDTRAAGINWLFSPILGLALEPKWSRVYETFGEDPKVVSEMGHHMIAGIQDVQEGSVPSRAAACAKRKFLVFFPHMIVYLYNPFSLVPLQTLLATPSQSTATTAVPAGYQHDTCINTLFLRGEEC